MAQPAAGRLTPAPIAVPPRNPPWVWPAILTVLGLVSLALAWYRPSQAKLWSFLPYTFLGNSLAPLPYDGAVIYLGGHKPIWLVVAIGVIGTVLVEAWNIELLRRILARDGTLGFRRHRLTRWSLHWYGKAPFWSLVGTCVLPIIPHYPMRFLVVLARYPMWKYQLSVILGRGGRYAWLAALGFSLPIPGWWIFVVSLVVLALGARGARKMNQEEAMDPVAPDGRGPAEAPTPAA